MPNPHTMAMLGNAHLSWKRYLQKALTPLGITLKQMYLLRQLADRTFLYPADIAEMLFCDRPTASVIIRNMERKGWLHRTRDQDNHKRVRIRLTEPGRAQLADTEPTFEAAVAAFDPLACFDAEERALLDRLLARQLEHLADLQGAETGTLSRGKGAPGGTTSSELERRTEDD